MAKKSASSGRGARRSRAARSVVGKLWVLGGLLVLLPLLFGKTVIGHALAGLAVPGLLLLVAAGLLTWWLRPAAPRGGAPSADALLQDLHAAACTRAPAAARAGMAAETATASRRRSIVGRMDVVAPLPPPPSAIAPAAAPVPSPVARPNAWSPAVFDAIEWRRFEALVEALFQQAGFETSAQSHGADGGIDIWLHSRHAPGTAVSLVQCKHWNDKPVGVDKVRELRGVMAEHGVARGQFATTSTFTPDAQVFARTTGIHLLDVQTLLAVIAKRTPEQQAALLAVALEGDYWRPTCVRCGAKMVSRQSRSNASMFWGCQTFPKCRHRMPMRARQRAQ